MQQKQSRDFVTFGTWGPKPMAPNKKRENPDFHQPIFVVAPKVKDVNEAIDFVQELKSDPGFKNAKKAIKHVTLTMNDDV